MNRSELIRSITAGVLSTSARVLSAGAGMLSGAARIVRPRPSRRPEAGAGETGDANTSDLRVSETPTVASGGVTHVRRPDTHTSELAARPAAEVIDAVANLSTDELRRLYEEEQTGKRRKTVLQAVERALTPSGASPT